MKPICIAACVAAVVLISCQTENEVNKTVPSRDVKTVMDAHVESLMAIPGVVAVAIGELDDGTPCIKIYVREKTDEVTAKIPERIEGHPVVVEESGEIRAMDDR